MATTEQLDLIIKMIADTSGAQQVVQALQKTTQAAAGAQQTLTSGQQGANAIFRGAMAQGQATLANFERLRESVRTATGVAPTLLPRDFGIQAAQAEKAAAASKAAAEATSDVGDAAEQGETNMLRFGLALAGAGGALSVVTGLGHLAREAFVGLVSGTVAQEQAFRANAVAMGQQATSFQSFAATVSQQAGVTTESLLEAGTAAAQLGRQVGFGPEQVQSLVAMGTALARIQGTDPSQTVTQLTAALQGNAQAAQALGLQLDSAFVAYTQIGGATAEVFNQLDPATQASLRYAAALEQIVKQADAASGPSAELAKQTGSFGKEMGDFVSTVGPGVVGALARIAEGANGVIQAIQHLNELTIERNKQSGGDEGFKTEQAALQGIGDRLAQGTDRLRTQVGQDISDLGTRAKELNDQLRDTTGFDAQATAANALGTATRVAQQGVDAVGQAASQAGSAIAQTATSFVQPWRDADETINQVRQDAEAARRAQLAALAGAVAGPTATLAAAQRNEVEAARALVDLKYQSVQLGAQEAAIRLDMLPAQQQMVELQNQSNRAQIEATQRALPAQRGLQDLQTQIEQQRLIAQSGFRSMDERQAALRTGAALAQQLPEAQLAASQAGAAALPAQRAAADVQTQAQLLALQQQSALFGPEFQRQQLTLLGQIADAAKQAAQRTVEISIQAINLAVGGFGALTEDDEKRLVDLAGQAVASQIHQAVVAVNTRAASTQLLGAT